RRPIVRRGQPSAKAIQPAIQSPARAAGRGGTVIGEIDAEAEALHTAHDSNVQGVLNLPRPVVERRVGWEVLIPLQVGPPQPANRVPWQRNDLVLVPAWRRGRETVWVDG